VPSGGPTDSVTLALAARGALGVIIESNMSALVLALQGSRDRPRLKASVTEPLYAELRMAASEIYGPEDAIAWAGGFSFPAEDRHRAGQFVFRVKE
jgi:hypothetical protein